MCVRVFSFEEKATMSCDLREENEGCLRASLNGSVLSATMCGQVLLLHSLVM